MALVGRNPGRLDQRITLLQPTVTNNTTTNAEVITYSTAGNVRAERVFKNSSERYEAQQQVGTSTEEFRIRDYSSLYAITQQWRFTWDEKTFNVKGIEKSGRRNYLILTGEYRDNG